MQSAVGESGDIGGARLRGDRLEYRGILRLAGVVPEIELAAQDVIKCTLKPGNEWTAVHLEESERNGEPHDRDDERHGEEERCQAPDEVCGTEPATHIDKLPERERAEYLVLDFDELRHLELHTIAASGELQAARCSAAQSLNHNMEHLGDLDNEGQCARKTIL